MATVEPMASEGTPQLPQVWTLESFLPEYEKKYLRRHEAFKSGKPLGPTTPFKALNKSLRGYFCPGFHIVHGAPGTGKTAFCLQIAAQCQCPSVFVSVEMDIDPIVERIVARTSGTFLDAIGRGDMLPSDVMALIRGGFEASPGLLLADAKRTPAPAQWVAETAEGWRDHHKAEHILIVIDSLHAWTTSLSSNFSGDMSERDRINQVLAWIGEITSHLSCAVLFIAHRNRSDRKGGGMASVLGSGQIEYLAENMISLEKSDGDSGSRYLKDITVKVDKSRHGPEGEDIILNFDGRIQEFTVRPMDANADDSDG